MMFLANHQYKKQGEKMNISKLKLLFKEAKTLLRSVPSLIFGLYLVALVMMNLLANKSIDLGVDYLALDCGLLFSWIVFLVMDLTTKRFGLKAANILTVAGLFVTLLISLVLFAAGSIKGIWSESFVFGAEEIINGALDNTFKGTWFVILGSGTAFFVSAVINNVLNYFIGKSLKKDNFVAFAIRSYASTFIGQFTDNLLFALIVSLNFFGWSLTQCITCALTGAVCELLFEVVFSPIGYRILRGWEKDGVGEEYLALLRGDND